MDILIEKSRIFDAKDCLLANDYYESHPTGAEKIADISHHHLPHILSPHSNIEIELHWTITENRHILNILIEDMWARKQPHIIAGLHTYVFRRRYSASPGSSSMLLPRRTNYTKANLQFCRLHS
ncbi:nucleotidyltransferase family protein [candidate division KSB1 bacterium]|nr:nucleotidyltransferase family protein [candidate division KSB1 bacterium]